MLVKKANEKWSMCVDFTNLNRVCPKDHYPFPSIDRLVDATIIYIVCFLCDALLRYHQIMMDEPDVEKTTFSTNGRVFYYRVMPFSLKNAGGTYQHPVNGLFKKYINKTIEVYIDDMIIRARGCKTMLTISL